MEAIAENMMLNVQTLHLSILDVNARVSGVSLLKDYPYVATDCSMGSKVETSFPMTAVAHHFLRG